MNKGHLELTLAVVPLAASGLYLLGFIYHIGYLDAFGIEDSLFPLASDRILLVGYIAIMDLGLIPTLYIFVAVCILLITVMIAAIISSISRVKELFSLVHEWINNKLTNKPNITQPPPEMDIAVNKISYLVAFVGGIFTILFLLAIVTLLASKSGEAEAKRQIEKYNNNETKWVMLHSTELPEAQKAMQIICSDKHCAFWTGTKSVVLKHNDITLIETHKYNKEEKGSDEASKNKR